MSTHQESPNQTPPETHDAKTFHDPKVIEPSPPKPDGDSKNLKGPNAIETPAPKPGDDSKTFNDQKAIEPPPPPKPYADSKNLKGPNAIETPPPKPDDDSKTFNDPQVIEAPPPKPDADSKNLKGPYAIETPPPKPDDDSKIFNDPQVIEAPPPKPDADSKNLKGSNAIETPPPNPDGDPKTFNDPQVIEAPPPKPDVNAKTPSGNETQPPKFDESLKDPNATDDPKTLKDPNVNGTLPSEIETSSENQPIAEVTETLKQAIATDADPDQAPPLDEKPNEILPADDDEPTSKQQSPPKNDFFETISNADPSPKNSSILEKLRNFFFKVLADKKNSQPRIAQSTPKKKELDRMPSMLTKAIEGDSKLADKGSEVLYKYKDSQPRIAQSTPKKKELDRMPSMLTKSIEGESKLADKGSEVLYKYKVHLKELHKASKKLEDREVEVTKKLKAQHELDKLQHELDKLHEDLIKLRLQITLKYKLDDKGSFKNFHFRSNSKQTLPQEVLAMMPQLHNEPFFETSPEFKDFEARYDNLDPKLKLCLLCFSIFPENAVIRKRVMVQWWISEGFASEEDANVYFIQLIKKGFIEPVNENRSLLVIGSCKIHPFYRSALVMLAERAAFLNFDRQGRATQNFTGSFRASLVGQGLISYEDYKADPLNVVRYLKKVHLLINIQEAVLEFKKDWFAMMKSLNYLYLGKWKAEDTDHREVEDTDFLGELQNMSYLKFLSLQGVSNMINLPESILKLKNLEILDIRACHNLETIPGKIGSLKWLTHLDMSDCFLIEQMPKDISKLTKLRVLKGFVVGENTRKHNKTSCTLRDLKELENLVKLCIYTGLSKFPEDEDVTDLGKLKNLKKLTITWGGNAFRPGDESRDDVSLKEDGLFPVLEKLDLRYFPKLITPDWLAVRNVKGFSSRLKKLYVRAGKFSDIGQYQESDSLEWPIKKDTWNMVEVLRLRYLPGMEMEWRQVQELFPSLVYLEQVGCPRLTLFPCDANGVWMKP